MFVAEIRIWFRIRRTSENEDSRFNKTRMNGGVLNPTLTLVYNLGQAELSVCLKIHIYA